MNLKRSPVAFFNSALLEEFINAPVGGKFAALFLERDIDYPVFALVAKVALENFPYSVEEYKNISPLKYSEIMSAFSHSLVEVIQTAIEEHLKETTYEFQSLGCLPEDLVKNPNLLGVER